jgi:hypothetical protein
MTSYDVYVGELSGGDDPLDWGGNPSVGNTPRAISPFFFPPRGQSAPFWRLIDKIERGEYLGKKVDWGAWAARVTQQQILDFVEETYRGHDWYTDATFMPHLYEQMRELLALSSHYLSMGISLLWRASYSNLRK